MNILFGWPLYSDVGVTYSPVLTGGSWSPSLPLTNLQERELHRVARSTDAALTSTIIKADLGVARALRLLALVGHNLSTAAKVRSRIMAAAPILDDNDFNGWTDIGTPVITTGQADPFAGTRATLLEDDAAGAAEGKLKVVAFTGDGVKAIGITMKAGSAGVSEFGIHDNTAGAFRQLVRVTWTGGVPSLSSVAGSGTLYAVQQIATGHYLLMALVDGVVAANTNRFIVYPAGSTAGNTGTVTAYEAMAWDLTTQPVLYDSGVVDAWPSGIDAESHEGYQKEVIHVLSAAVTARYARIEIADTANTDGYVEAGRLVIAGGFVPTLNFAPGAKLGFEDDSTRVVTDGSSAIYNTKGKRRRMVVGLPELPYAEALANLLDMQARLGITKQLFVVMDPDDSTNLHRQSFLAVLRELSDLETPYYYRRNGAVSLGEEV